MRLVIISDTHGHHEELGILEGDILLHCGDGCSRDPDSVERLDRWFGKQRFRHIFAVSGNHDRAIETRVERGLPVFRYATYLQDRLVERAGFRIYGAPWVPDLQGWSFYLDSLELRQRWSQIPEDLDVLMTHTPPRGVLDHNRRGRACGCPLLTEAVEQRMPRLHAFGHIHASAGSTFDGITHSVNGASLKRSGELREPITVDLPARVR